MPLILTEFVAEHRALRLDKSTIINKAKNNDK